MIKIKAVDIKSMAFLCYKYIIINKYKKCSELFTYAKKLILSHCGIEISQKRFC